MNLPPDLPEGSSLWTMGAGALASLLYLRRFLSRQGVDIRKDSAESNLIKTLQDERDKAMAAAEKAWETRTEDAKLIGELTSEVRSSRVVIEDLKSKLSEMRTEMQQLSMELHSMRGEINGQA
jgi:chromosome segregation ATPase